MHKKACDDPLLPRKQAAAYIGYEPETLAKWHSRKTRDLKPVKKGGRVYYRRSVLDAFNEGELMR